SVEVRLCEAWRMARRRGIRTSSAVTSATFKAGPPVQEEKQGVGVEILTVWEGKSKAAWQGRRWKQLLRECVARVVTLSGGCAQVHRVPWTARRSIHAGLPARAGRCGSSPSSSRTQSQPAGGGL